MTQAYQDNLPWKTNEEIGRGGSIAEDKRAEAEDERGENERFVPKTTGFGCIVSSAGSAALRLKSVQLFRPHRPLWLHRPLRLHRSVPVGLIFRRRDVPAGVVQIS